MKSDEDGLKIKELTDVDDETSTRGANSILLLPLNWPSSEEESVYSASTDSVTKLFAENCIPFHTLTPLTAETRLRDERAMDWVAPTMFVTGALLSQNPMAVSLALNVMANYATDLFRGIRNDPKVKLTIVQTKRRGNSARELHYEGPASGLPPLAKILSTFDPRED